MVISGQQWRGSHEAASSLQMLSWVAIIRDCLMWIGHDMTHLWHCTYCLEIGHVRRGLALLPCPTFSGLTWQPPSGDKSVLTTYRQVVRMTVASRRQQDWSHWLMTQQPEHKCQKTSLCTLTTHDLCNGRGVGGLWSSEGDSRGEEMERSCITYSAHGGLQVAIRILADNVSNATVVLTSKLTGEQPCPSEGTHQRKKRNCTESCSHSWGLCQWSTMCWPQVDKIGGRGGGCEKMRVWLSRFGCSPEVAKMRFSSGARVGSYLNLATPFLQWETFEWKWKWKWRKSVWVHPPLLSEVLCVTCLHAVLGSIQQQFTHLFIFLV